MAQTDRQTHTHNHGHGDSMTNSAQWGRVGEKGWYLEFYTSLVLFRQKFHNWKSTFEVMIEKRHNIFFKASALWADAFYKSKCPSVCLWSVRVFTFELPFKHLFAPTFWSRMSKIFRDSESLGKSIGKKWSQIETFLFGSGLKLPKKKSFFWLILPYKTWWKPRFPMD